ncbi:TetR/AcrR family transcriptional regulator [Kineosporia succinea]
MEAAVELMDASGDGRGVTLRSVARRVGIAAPSIYPHFPDREAVLLAVVHRSFAQLEADLLAARGPSGPRHRLEAVCTAYLDFAAGHPERYRTMFGGGGDPAGVTGTLRRCLEDCGAPDPAVDAVALWLGLHGLAHQRAVLPHFRWPAGITSDLVRTLARLTG